MKGLSASNLEPKWFEPKCSKPILPAGIAKKKLLKFWNPEPKKICRERAKHFEFAFSTRTAPKNI